MHGVLSSDIADLVPSDIAAMRMIYGPEAGAGTSSALAAALKGAPATSLAGHGGDAGFAERTVGFDAEMLASLLKDAGLPPGKHASGQGAAVLLDPASWPAWSSFTPDSRTADTTLFVCAA